MSTAPKTAAEAFKEVGTGLLILFGPREGEFVGEVLTERPGYLEGLLEGDLLDAGARALLRKHTMGLGDDTEC